MYKSKQLNQKQSRIYEIGRTGLLQTLPYTYEKNGNYIEMKKYLIKYFEHLILMEENLYY